MPAAPPLKPCIRTAEPSNGPMKRAERKENTMRKLIMSAAIIATLASAAIAASRVTCPIHSWASCYDTGTVAPGNVQTHKFHCACNDDVWAKR